MKLYPFIIYFIIISLSSCIRAGENKTTNSAGPNCEYAANFGIHKKSDHSQISIKSMSEKGKSEVWTVLNTDIEYNRIVCMSTSHISYIEALGEASRIVGVSGGQYVSSSYIRQGLSDGRIADIGYEGSLNYELLLSLNPDLVLTYGIDGENNQYIDKIKQFDINVIALGDYLENHPLGKLEYIKLFGALLNKENEADSFYNDKKLKYLDLKKITSDLNRTKVLINAPWKEVWYIPGKESYMNLLIEDAGGMILGAADNSSYTQAFSIEEVFILSKDAEVWVNPNSISSMKELTNATPLFSNIYPVTNKRVYNNIKLSTPGGGSQFWESGVIEPDIILKDLISILHPDILKNYIPKYYIHLK